MLEPAAPAVLAAAPGRWSILANCLTISCSAAFDHLEHQFELATGAGGRPFEVMAGAPFARYGARAAFTAPPAAMWPMAAALGVGHHPWGTPSWVGVRVSPAGLVRIKLYHRIARLNGRFQLPHELPGDLYPVMAALDGDTREIYLRAGTAHSWDSFAAACLAPLGGGAYLFAPHPRPAPHAHCVSLKWDHDALFAITLYADHRALPDDQTTGRQWAANLDPVDSRAYEMALAGARSIGRLHRGAWHAMLAWTLEANGQWHRAASLSVP
jgi:hypothetical protein